MILDQYFTEIFKICDQSMVPIYVLKCHLQIVNLVLIIRMLQLYFFKRTYFKKPSNTYITLHLPNFGYIYVPYQKFDNIKKDWPWIAKQSYFRGPKNL